VKSIWRSAETSISCKLKIGRMEWMSLKTVTYPISYSYKYGIWSLPTLPLYKICSVKRTRMILYIITTVKHAIWLVNSRAGSGYPARGIKMPSRDFRGILKMSLFHCSYFIKQLPNGFPSRIAWSMHLGCCSTFGKRKNTLACGSSIFTLSESLATSLVNLVHGSRNPARKTIRYSFNTVWPIYWPHRLLSFCKNLNQLYVKKKRLERLLNNAKSICVALNYITHW
jgi:hypothetical protein